MEKGTRLWLAGAVLLTIFTGSAHADPSQRNLTEHGPAPAPAAFHAFCKQWPDQCARRNNTKLTLQMTPDIMAKLQAVNREVNGTIHQVSDWSIHGREDVWTLTVNGRGDCEDLALLKRKRLMDMGLPSSALLITVVRTWNGEGHAVLSVVTDKGDYILDSRRSGIRLWSNTGYTFFTRQMASDPRRFAVVAPMPSKDLLARARRHPTAAH